MSVIHLAFYSKPPTIKKVHKELAPSLRSGHSCCNLINQQRLETAFLCRADVVGCVPQQELSNTHKVHNLCNAKERGYDKGPASSSLEERSRTLFSQDLPAMNKTRFMASRPSQAESLLVMLRIQSYDLSDVYLIQSTTPLYVSSLVPFLSDWSLVLTTAWDRKL